MSRQHRSQESQGIRRPNSAGASRRRLVPRAPPPSPQQFASLRAVETGYTPVHLSPRGSPPFCRSLSLSRVPPPFASELLFWSAAAICAVAQVAVIRAALAGRTPGASVKPLARAREFFWVILPAALLILLLVWTWHSLPARFVQPREHSAGNIGAMSHPVRASVKVNS